MKKLRNTISVETKAEYRSLLMAGMLPFPHTVYVKNDGETVISGKEITKENAMPGNLVCFNRDGGMKIFDISNVPELPLGYAPEAMVVLPSDHDPLGEGRIGCMSLVSVYGTNGTMGAVNDSFMGFKGIAVNEELDSMSYMDHGYIPSDLFAVDGKASYSDSAVEDGNMSPSPYDNNLAYNEAYGESVVDNDEGQNVLAKADSALANKSLMNDSQVSEDTGLYGASVYSTDNIPSGDWLLPSMYELGHLYNRLGIINDVLSSLKGGEEIPHDSKRPRKLLSWNCLIDSDGAAYVWSLNPVDGRASLDNLGQATEQRTIEGGEYNVRAFTYL